MEESYILSLSGLDIAAIVVFAAALVLAGVWANKRQGGSEDEFFVAGGKMGFWTNMATHMATQIGAGDTIAAAGLGFVMGFGGWSYTIALAIAFILFIFFLVKPVRRLKMYTVGDILKARYGRILKVIAGIILPTMFITSIAGQLVGSGLMLNMFGVDLHLGMVIGALIALVYTVTGGLWAVALTDAIQWVVMLVGIVFILVPVSISNVGGFGAMAEALPPEYFKITTYGGWELAGLIFSIVLAYGIGTDVYQRIWAAKSDKVAKGALAGSAILFVVFGFCGVVVGMAAKVLYPDINPESALPMMIAEHLPSGVRGLVLIALAGAVLSTIDSMIHSGSTVVTIDLLEGLGMKLEGKKRLQAARIACVALTVLGIVFAMALQNVYDLLLWGYTIAACGIAIPVLGGMLWKRATKTGALASCICGSVAGILWQLFATGSPIPVELAGGAVALVTFIGVSLATKPPSQEQIDAIFIGNRQEEAAPAQVAQAAPGEEPAAD